MTPTDEELVSLFNLKATQIVIETERNFTLKDYLYGFWYVTVNQCFNRFFRPAEFLKYQKLMAFINNK